MAEWETPKTDWDSSQQGVTDADFNRIEKNIEYLGGSRPLLDTEGNIYPVITIDGLVWATVNWKSAFLGDGTALSNVTDQTAWDNLTGPAYCKYDNELELDGFLYNYASLPLLAPEGWRVATESDWANTFDYLIASGHSVDRDTGDVGGAKMGKSVASSLGWDGTGTIDAPGNLPWLNNNSKLGLTPGGRRTTAFDGVGQDARYWSYQDSASFDRFVLVQHDNASLTVTTGSNTMPGYSVRMVRDV